MSDLYRRAANGEHLLRCCGAEYGKAIAAGRLEEWARMTHAIIDLLAPQGVHTEKMARIDPAPHAARAAVPVSPTATVRISSAAPSPSDQPEQQR